MRGPLLSGITVVLSFMTWLSVPTAAAPDGEPHLSQSRHDEHSSETPLPVVPEARDLVLERLVPTKKLTNIQLLRAVMRVPRQLFVPKGFRDDAYTDLPIPLGSGQTLVSPFEIVYALQQLNLYPSDQILIIGPGVGYPAAVAAQLVDRVTALETLSSLMRRNNDAVKKLGINNIRIKGVSPEQAEKETGTFDKILVLSSFPNGIPTWLTDRLNEGGALAAPIGSFETQQLCLFTRNGRELNKEPLIGVCPALPFIVRGQTSASEENDALLEESFEYAEADTESFIPGWFDLRNVCLRPDTSPSDGQHILLFDSTAVRTEQKRKDALRRKELAGGEDTAESGAVPPDLELSPLTLRQREEERATLAIRVFRLNGKNTHKISFTCRMEGVGLVSEQKSRRVIATSSLVFFDEDRNPLQEIPLTALRTGDTPWKEYRVPSITVPKKTKTAELRLGLFSGSGILKVDTIAIRRVKSPDKNQ